jgi:hypothetical protein
LSRRSKHRITYGSGQQAVASDWITLFYEFHYVETFFWAMQTCPAKS